MDATALREEVLATKPGPFHMRAWLMAQGYRRSYTLSVPQSRAEALYALLDGMKKTVYPHDEILGNISDMFDEKPEKDNWNADAIVNMYGFTGFWNNTDHCAPDYFRAVAQGLDGMLEEISASEKKHKEEQALQFLAACRRSIEALVAFALGYADAAEKAGRTEAAIACRNIAHKKPQTLREGLQLVWLIHLALTLEGRYAMALGRLDQYLYPLYLADKAKGVTDREVTDLIACCLIKIGQLNICTGSDDVVNIAIGGVKAEDGSCAENELTFCILNAVRFCNIPGPNLTARFSRYSTDKFYNACLDVIGTGLGYPALTSDEVNIPALARHGYDIKDVRNYCFVGCIENFIQGKQAPWSDGRYNSPKYIELALNGGVCMQTGEQMGPKTPMEFATMDDFMDALRVQMQYGAEEYVRVWSLENVRYNKWNYAQPLLSCFIFDCIGRAKDVNDGGAKYLAAHGPGCMGIGTFSDSLCAIEQAVFEQKFVTMDELRTALKADFEGYEPLRQRLLALPKYGNDNDAVDKYACFFVEEHDRIFAQFRTPQGGPLYIGIASNTANIPAGQCIAATPDGRHNGVPLSDAASPMHGLDISGPTAVVNSTTKPDFTHASCATVLNQKFNPELFNSKEMRPKLVSLIRAYFAKGGQEMQINSVSKETLADAMEHPDEYGSLVVRVSGFSAYYTQLSKEVQKDILARTEHTEDEYN